MKFPNLLNYRNKPINDKLEYLEQQIDYINRDIKELCSKLRILAFLHGGRFELHQTTNSFGGPAYKEWRLIEPHEPVIPKVIKTHPTIKEKEKI